MNKKNKFLNISFIVILGLVLTYFFINNYVDNKYADKLPVVPVLNEASVSSQEYITNSNTKALESPSATNLGKLGMTYHANNFFKEAETCYLLAIERAPKEWEWSYYLGCLKRELGDSETAINYFKKVLDVRPNLFMASYYLADAYNQIGDTIKFEEILKKLSKIDKKFFELEDTKRTSYVPLNLYASLELSKFYATNGKVNLAESKLKELISSEKSFGPAYKQLSIIYAEKGNSELSEYYSVRSKDLEDYYPPPDLLLDKLNYYSRSETYLLKQIEDAIRSGNLLWAEELVNFSLKKVPESKYIVSKAIRLYIVMNRASNAIQYINRHLEDFKDDYKELEDIGKGFSNSGLRNVAQRYFLAAGKIENEKPETKSRLAGIYFDRLGMKEKAFELIDTLLKEHPNNSAVIGGAAFLYIQERDMATANKYLLELEKVDPKNPRIKIFKGIIAKNSGDLKKAIEFYEQAFRETPDNFLLINYLVDYYKNNRMWNALANLYQTALKSSPNDPNLLVASGSFLINCPDKKIKNPKQAKEYSERALINFRSNVQIKVTASESLAMCYFELNEKGKALYYTQKAIDDAKDARFPKEYIKSLQAMSNSIKNYKAN
jgi:tetratricopeptide (TPR) repeat protein